MNKIAEIEEFFETLDLPTNLSKWLYIERLVRDEMLVSLEREATCTLIRSYYQLTAYFNYCYLTKELNSEQMGRLSQIRIEINNESHPIVYWLGIYSLLQIDDLGISNRDLNELKARTRYYISYIRPVLIEFVANENQNLSSRPSVN